ncbi:histone-lysine N-methyltransferase, H3 lysine-79 specific-like [Tachypleus tridentatus]|uniref:histone-lysine N-methyltransferase, H3 lysine-79 specific-like n=1 Tax=Tachypleus tridentatus TaxID=6853 RepID=UPI003FD4D917
MSEMGIHANLPSDLLKKTKEIVLKHKELQTKASLLQCQISSLESENNLLLATQNNKMNLPLESNGLAKNVENSPVMQDHILKEISSTLTQRNVLHSKVQKLENEVYSLEKVSVTKQKLHHCKDNVEQKINFSVPSSHVGPNVVKEQLLPRNRKNKNMKTTLFLLQRLQSLCPRIQNFLVELGKEMQKHLHHILMAAENRN